MVIWFRPYNHWGSSKNHCQKYWHEHRHCRCRRSGARIKKPMKRKLFGATNNLGFIRPRWPFLQPLAAILDFAGSVALQAVRSCRLCVVAGGVVLQAVQCCRRCGVASGAVLQAVQCCRRCGVAGSERVPQPPLGRYTFPKQKLEIRWSSS